MRAGWICTVAFFLLIMGSAGPAVAQVGDQAGDEVKRAVASVVSSSIASAIADSVSRSIVGNGLGVMPTTTVFGGPFYNRIDAGFSSGSESLKDLKGTTLKLDTFGGLAGFVYKVKDIEEDFLVHGVVFGSRSNADVKCGPVLRLKSDRCSDAPGGAFSTDVGFVNVTLGGNLLFVNTQSVKGWITLEGGPSNVSLDTGNTWFWTTALSATLSLRAGPILLEPTVGALVLSDLDSGPNVPPPTTTFETGFSLKYRGGTFRPQLNVFYAKTVEPPRGDDGSISVTPEILYAISPSVLLGGAYSYATSLGRGIDITSHTGSLEFRWIF